jgi:hypothetical protein
VLKVPGCAIESISLNFSIFSSRFHLDEFELSAFGALKEAQSMLPSMHFIEQMLDKARE